MMFLLERCARCDEGVNWDTYYLPESWVVEGALHVLPTDLNETIELSV